MKRALALGCLFLASQAAAQAPSPAQLGITPTTNPENLQVLDSTKTWVPLGGVYSDTHTFVPVGGGGGGGGTGEADILVTDPTVGMAAGGADNAPHISALMAKMGPSAFNSYDVTFPSIPGQSFTEYYFTQPFVLSRGGNYHCSGSTWRPGVRLVFAPGIDGVIQESRANVGGASDGAGIVSGCGIDTMGHGTATANPITPTVLTGIAFIGDPAGVIPLSTWAVGDGIILTASLNRFNPADAIPVVPPGTTITVSSGSTVTLSNPVSQALSSATSLHSTAVFTETGSNNFANSEPITVGDTTYTFATACCNTLNAANTILLGVDFATSAANLVAAVNGTTGEFSTYVPTNYTSPSGYGPNLHIKASYASGVITFTSLYGGPAANAYPSTYAGSAGAFGGATFTGAQDSISCPAPCTAANVSVHYYQLPGPNSPNNQAFKIQTTAGSQTITVISGPRPFHAGDPIWSDAFPFGTIAYKITAGTTFPYTVIMGGPNDLSTAVNATVTHAPGSEGNLWVIPTALKRRTAAVAEHNVLSGWPIGMTMLCSANQSYNCDLARDRDNWHQLDLIGRWVGGDNTSTAASYDEQFSNNFIADIVELGALGEMYYNPNTESPESSTARWGWINNCTNQNYSVIFGGYLSQQTLAPDKSNSCAPTGGIYPPLPGGSLLIGPLAGFSSGPTFKSTGNGLQYFGTPVTWASGNDNAQVFTLGSSPGGTTAFSVSSSGSPTLSLTWNNLQKTWGWYDVGNFPLMTMSAASSGASSAGFPGIVLGNQEQISTLSTNSRSLSVGPSAGLGAWHGRGDVVLNLNPVVGGTEGLTSVAGSSSFTGTIAGTNLTMPSVTTGVVAIGQTVAGAGVTAGTKITAGSGLSWTVDASQTVGPVAMTTSSWYPFGVIAQDQAGTTYRIGAQVAIASLPACAATNVGFATISNGQTIAAAGYGVAVSTTGSSIRPIFCDGSSWTYH